MPEPVVHRDPGFPTGDGTAEACADDYTDGADARASLTDIARQQADGRDYWPH